ncbi:hypothetical protein [Vibrio genomosp. F10]|uniref:hypothetical protein n=1 Tax=Vibrio genomosp. F10 TaxID=723171 RepID=UPI00114CA447|nr:hypothetical protein [Vibrio genomosp. F10]
MRISSVAHRYELGFYGSALQFGGVCEVSFWPFTTVFQGWGFTQKMRPNKALNRTNKRLAFLVWLAAVFTVVI